MFSCDRFHNLVGSPEIFCNDNGNWTERTPYCERKFKEGWLTSTFCGYKLTTN